MGGHEMAPHTPQVFGAPRQSRDAPLSPPRIFGIPAARAPIVAVERRRGWTETADTPLRAAGDMWDQARERITVEKPRPGAGGGVRLRVRGHYAAFRAAAPGDVVYDVVEGDGVTPLEDVQWADWD